MKLTVVTSNQGKLKEFRSVLEPMNIQVLHSLEDCNEIQADTLKEVVLDCIDQLKKKGLRDFVIDDSGLFISSLRGFPGVYSSYALRTIGLNGVLRLLEGQEDRSAFFQSCIGCSIEGLDDIIVAGRCDGRIVFSPRGTEGFGFDPIFVPNGYVLTFSEMSIEEKNRISHRGLALRAFVSELMDRKGD